MSFFFYSYDINRNLSMIITSKGVQIKLYNNAANIVEKKFLPEGVVDYTYDTEYNLTRATNADSDLSFTYDLLSRLSTTQTAGIVQPTTSISYTYDLNSNLTSMTDPAGTITNYVYDTLNRITGTTDAYGVYISSYTYDGLSRRIGKSVLQTPTPLTTNYTYDIASQLLSITNLPTTITASYTYDNIGNRLSLTDNNGLHSYTYDNLYRVTDSSNPAEHYDYDPVGNRNPLIQIYDSGNRLLDDGTYTYTYDHDGNMVSKTNKTNLETTTYFYNSEDQLIGVTTPTQAISYKYDALDRRIEKNVSGMITRYIYDGEDIIQELDGNSQIIATYTHGPGTDEPILLEKNGQKYYYISDGLGSIIAIVDQNGNIAQTYRYDSFGNIISSTGSLTQPYTYTGREYNPETGLYYYRARYYDPKTGRFLQEDPIWNKNAYAYCYNNPLNLVDPSGRIVWILAGAAIGMASDLTVQLMMNGGHLSQVSLTSVAISGLAGAAGVGLGSAVATITKSIVMSTVLNAAGNAAIGAGATALRNSATCSNQSVSKAAMYSGFFGGLGSVANSALPALGNYIGNARFAALPLGDKLWAISNSVTGPVMNTLYNTGFFNKLGNISGLAFSQLSDLYGQ